MVKVRLMVITSRGPYTRMQNVGKANLRTKYVRISFRGKPTYIKRDGLGAILEEAENRRLQAGPGLPMPTRGNVGVLTEEFFVRDDYRGGGRKRGKDGKSRGTHGRVSVEVRVLFTGTRAERDQAFDRLEQMFISQMPFLARKGGLIGREVADAPSPQKVRVVESRLDGKANRQMGRNVFFDLESV